MVGAGTMAETTTKASHIREVRTFLKRNLRRMRPDSSGRVSPEIPSYDLYARDYLESAEESLNRYLDTVDVHRKRRALVDYVQHLKRAMDCQLETFLHAYGLSASFAKQNFNVPKKLDFVRACGLFSTRTLTRLNTIRNRMEHRFEVPEISNVEVYFDLVCAFVAILESAVSAWTDHDLIIGGPENQGWFRIECDRKSPKVIVAWKTARRTMKFESTPANISEFAFMMRIVFLLHTRDSFASDRYILRQLDET
jgi:hypothetical protein